MTTATAAQPAATSSTSDFPVADLRKRFPALQQQVHGKPLAYLDNAATSQKPDSVIEAIDDYYRRYNANVHRGLHHLAEQATEAYEGARAKVAGFIHAPSAQSCVFVRGATEGINLVAQSHARPKLGPGDRVLITEMEHHSNIVPWQLVCEQTGASLDVLPFNDAGELEMGKLDELLTERTKIVAAVWISNSLGTINPIKELVAAAKQVGASSVVDACQAAPHTTIDVSKETGLDPDFLAFSGHKMFGPTGIGVLYGRAELLEAMPPYQGGGEMVDQVRFSGTTYDDPPHRFEAGTPHIAGAVGLGAAVEFMQSLDMAGLEHHEQALRDYATEKLNEIDGLRLIGTAPDKAAILSFVIDGMHAYDIGPVVDRYGVAVRTGHHCTQPVMDHYHIPATVRASLAFYNTYEDIDAMIEGLHKARKFFA